MSTSFWWGPVGGEGTLQWTAPSWVWGLALCVALVAWWLAWKGERSRRHKVLELACWAAALAGMVVALGGPVWVQEEGHLEPGRNVVLIDASRSMSVLEGGVPRSAQVRDALARIQAQVGAVEVYHFGSDLQVGAPSDFTLQDTNLSTSLEGVRERFAGERLASLSMITDGADRSPMRWNWKSGAPGQAPSLPGPLTVFQAGSDHALKDVAVRSVDSGGFAFLRQPFRLTAQVHAVGMAMDAVPVTLEQDGAVVTTRTIPLDEDGRGEATFEVTPAQAGRFSYAIRVPTFEGDAVPSNNVLPVVVRVMRDRIRILQVAGAPSWDVKFLRRFLKGDPSVQLVSFFILRTTSDLVTPYRDDELSLIQFPYRRLFDEDLWSFDVVVFQNFDHADYFQSESTLLLANIAQYVQEGGAFVMMGGDRSFSLGGYGGTPLEEVLPVTLSAMPSEPIEEAFRPVLTASGARHPVTRLLSSPEENQEWWGRLGEMEGINRVEGLNSGATLLLAHPDAVNASGASQPVLAVREVGAGRTMALMTDSSWRWSMAEVASGRGNQAYLRFWKGALRWLMRDESTARVTVSSGRENYGLGEEVRLVIRARGVDFARLDGAEVELEVSPRDGEKSLHSTTLENGEAAWVLPATGQGAHRVTARVRHRGQEVGRGESVFAVTSRDPELEDVTADPEFLSWLASSHGGERYDAESGGDVVIDPDAGRTVRERVETSLGRTPGLMAWVMVFSALGWWTRRRSGLR